MLEQIDMFETNSRPSQENRILDYLKSGRSLTPLEALDLFGCLRLSARIKKLREMGYSIVTHTEERNGKRFARYSLA